MKLKLATLLLLFICIFSSTAQELDNQVNTLEKQFDDLYRKSSSYQVYKVISKEKYQQLKQNVLDSINTLETKVSQKNNLLTKNSTEIEKTKQELALIKQNLDNSVSRENSISLFGIQLSKTSYNLMLWSIIVLLLAGLGYFIFKFFRSNVLTKEAQQNLIEVENEFETHRKKSLEREQKLRRKLQDEINKQRNS
jgi:uncharacterized membrane-anchored protein YhcB (DUF1043 family)